MEQVASGVFVNDGEKTPLCAFTLIGRKAWELTFLVKVETVCNSRLLVWLQETLRVFNDC